MTVPHTVEQRQIREQLKVQCGSDWVANTAALQGAKKQSHAWTQRGHGEAVVWNSKRIREHTLLPSAHGASRFICM